MSDILLINLAATWYMTGLIWFVQLVHYPLFADVPADGFLAYHQRHMDTTGYAVGPPMVIELVTAVLLVIWRPLAVPPWIVWTGITLVIAIWLSTALIQVPLHYRLDHDGSSVLIRRLVLTNWVRTILWTGRAGLMVWGVRLCLRG